MLFFAHVTISSTVESIPVNWNIFFRIFKFYLFLLCCPNCFLYTQNDSRCGNSIEFDKSFVSKRSFFYWFFIINWHLIVTNVCTKLLNIFLCDWHPILRVHKQRKITISNTARYFITFINGKNLNIQKSRGS